MVIKKLTIFLSFFNTFNEPENSNFYLKHLKKNNSNLKRDIGLIAYLERMKVHCCYLVIYAQFRCLINKEKGPKRKFMMTMMNYLLSKNQN